MFMRNVKNKCEGNLKCHFHSFHWPNGSKYQALWQVLENMSFIIPVVWEGQVTK